MIALMSRIDVLGWAFVVLVVTLALLLIIVAVVAAVQHFKNNPVKKSFDVDPDTLDSREQDK